jgi:DNA-binding HxlR family transcriptional regulator
VQICDRPPRSKQQSEPDGSRPLSPTAIRQEARNAFDGIRRFGEFQKDLGLSKSVLASRLHALVSNGILRIEPSADGSAYQEYGLTEKGRGLFHVVVGLRQWGEAFLFSHNEEHSVMIDRNSQESVQTLELRSQRGKLLTPNDVVVRKVRAREGSRSNVPGGSATRK